MRSPFFWGDAGSLWRSIVESARMDSPPLAARHPSIHIRSREDKVRLRLNSSARQICWRRVASVIRCSSGDVVKDGAIMEVRFLLYIFAVLL